MANPVEPLKVRYERYQNALSSRDYWDTTFEQAYKWCMPNRMSLFENGLPTQDTNHYNRGQERDNHIFDPTGQDSLFKFANNLQTMMMPFEREYLSVELNEDVKDSESAFQRQFGTLTDDVIDSVKIQLDKANRILLESFNKGRLSNVINESFLDLGISTGVLTIQKGTSSNPIRFESVPAHQLIIEGGPCNTLENFYFPRRVQTRHIKDIWPKANIPRGLDDKMDDKGQPSVMLIDAVLTYYDPSDPDKKIYYHFVMTEDGENELFSEFLDYDPFTAFRGMVAPGEVYGRGPALTALPTIRELNAMAEAIKSNFLFSAYGVYLFSGAGDINPNTLNIEPGALINIGGGMRPQEAITRLDTGQPANQPEGLIQFLQEQVRDIMFANPIGPQGLPGKTATEATIANNNWIRKNAGFFSRVSNELFPQLVDKSFMILHQMGHVPLIDINGVKVPIKTTSSLFNLRYQSPLTKVQDEEDVTAMAQGVQFMNEMFGGPEGLLAFNIEKLPEMLLEKLRVPTSAINLNFDTEIAPLVKSIKDRLGSMGQAPQQNPSVPGSTAPMAAQQVAQQSLNRQAGAI